MTAVDLHAFLAAQANKSLLRFLTCGSVDDGKSTLIGRLLRDARVLFDDQVAALESDSKKHGSGGDLDFALLLDGLEAEREQGITIDVAYRFFATEKRRFIVADTPGHEQYTRNMTTGASTSELAVIVVDARKGILLQTRRHAYIASLLGIKHVVLAVNKVDLVGYSAEVFERVARDFRDFAGPLTFETSVAIPLSGRFGDNVFARSENTPWYAGPTLMAHLESVNTSPAGASQSFRLPVQWINHHEGFRGVSGTVSAGAIAAGDAVVVATTGRASKVARIVTMDGDLREAIAGQAVTLVLADEIDVSRGDLLARPEAPPQVSEQFGAHVLWMAEEDLLPGRQYLLKSAAKTVVAHVSSLKHKVDVSTFGHLAARTLRMNEVGNASFALAEPLAFDAYRDNRDTGSFIMIDRVTNHTVAAGMIDASLRCDANVEGQTLTVTQAARAAMKGQTAAVLWFTGLSASGKSTIANLVERKLAGEGRHTYLLDGDNIRQGLSRDLGFTDADRVENIRRVAETSKLFVDAGLIVLAAFISPFRSEREAARALLGALQFIEVFVDTPIDVCIARDPKGLYKRALAGDIEHFTGIDSAYERPDSPDLVLDTVAADASALADEVVFYLKSRGYVP